MKKEIGKLLLPMLLMVAGLAALAQAAPEDDDQQPHAAYLKRFVSMCRVGPASVGAEPYKFLGVVFWGERGVYFGIDPDGGRADLAHYRLVPGRSYEFDWNDTQTKTEMKPYLDELRTRKFMLYETLDLKAFMNLPGLSECGPRRHS